MISQTSDEQLKYIFTVLKCTEMNQPDYKRVAQEAGINSANSAQKKFKSIVEAAGFALVNKQIVDPSSEAVTSDAPSTPAKRPRAKKPTPAHAKSTPKSTKAAALKSGYSASKKRKVEEVVLDSDSEAESAVEVKDEKRESDGEETVAGDGTHALTNSPFATAAIGGCDSDDDETIKDEI